MRLIRAKDYTDASRKAAEIIAAQVALKPDCVLGLATGSTPIGTYQELIAKCRTGAIDFSQVKTVNLDEYVGLSKDHDQSYAYFMRHNLFDDINIDQRNCHIPDGLTADPDAECANYDKLIAVNSGSGKSISVEFEKPKKYYAQAVVYSDTDNMVQLFKTITSEEVSK